MNDFETFLEKAGTFHGHVCAGIILGTKMTLAAMKALGLDARLKNKDLIVYAEIDRCMTDAIQAITGCSLGHRSLKHIDYGKFAATFVNLKTGKAFRASVRETFNTRRPVKELSEMVSQMPDSEIVILQEVKVDITETDLPGSPRKKAYCGICGERVMDGRVVKRDDVVICRACANGPYYKGIPRLQD